MLNNIDFNAISESAYKSLLSLTGSSFPIDPVKNELLCSDLRIISYQEYAKLAQIASASIEAISGLRDGFSFMKVKGRALILYNDIEFVPRKRFTISHEIGHFILEHEKHSVKEEIEANFFASQFLAPTPILAEISLRGYEWSLEEIMKLFYLSRESAKKKLSYWNKNKSNNSHETLYDEYIVHKFRQFLDGRYPPLEGSMRSIWDENDMRLKSAGAVHGEASLIRL